MAGIWRRRPGDGRGRRAENGVTEAGIPHRTELPDANAIVERLPEGVVIVDADRAVSWLNPAAAQMFSAIDQPQGRQLVEVIRDHRIEALAERVRGSAQEQSLEVELAVTARIVQVRALPLPGQRVALIMLDISRVRYLETVRQQFVANLSHEIRTPLAGLDLAAQTLSEQLPDTGDTRVFIDRVTQESQRLQAILLNLTQLAALDAEGIEVERAPFEVGQLLVELVGRYEQRAKTAGLSMRAQPPDLPLTVFGDRAKTEQALQNIVDNALKFTRTGEVVLSAHADPGRVEITVRDTGVGIPPRDLPRIFERFYKVDRARGGQPGSGLGLSISRHLIELQGGTITADSSPGVGTQVQVRLPRAL